MKDLTIFVGKLGNKVGGNKRHSVYLTLRTEEPEIRKVEDYYFAIVGKVRNVNGKGDLSCGQILDEELVNELLISEEKKGYLRELIELYKEMWLKYIRCIPQEKINRVVEIFKKFKVID